MVAAGAVGPVVLPLDVPALLTPAVALVSTRLFARPAIEAPPAVEAPPPLCAPPVITLPLGLVPAPAGRTVALLPPSAPGPVTLAPPVTGSMTAGTGAAMPPALGVAAIGAVPVPLAGGVV